MLEVGEITQLLHAANISSISFRNKMLAKNNTHMHTVVCRKMGATRNNQINIIVSFSERIIMSFLLLVDPL